MEYLFFNFLNALSSVFDIDNVANVIRDWLGDRDYLFTDLLLSDVISYVIYFIVVGYIISFLIRFFVACFRKVCEVIVE